MGEVHGIQHFVPRMLAAEPGHIVNTASMAGWLNAPLMGVYNISKHAVVALTESLHHDLKLANSKIGVTLLSPAFVPTGIAQSHRRRPAELANDTVLASVAARVDAALAGAAPADPFASKPELRSHAD